jgi:glycosyltransferase involved in cell wall biosynthesis
MNTIVPDGGIFDKLPVLKEHPFYFTLGSLSLRKNLKWIVDHAELYPAELFVISGTVLKNVVPPELEKLHTLSNVISAGYLSDGEVKALMQKCKAFIFPSYFEGFGLPPLEALACGAQIIISNAASLPEIYGKCAHYIEPFNPDIDLDRLLAEPVDSPAPLFEKYSLDRSAAQLYELLAYIGK